MFNLWILAQIGVVLAFIYLYIVRKYSYWSSRGVRGPKPIFPVGYQLDKALTPPDVLERKWLSEFGKVYGVYSGLKPTLTVCDADLIKQILIKDFHMFVNRRSLSPYNPHWNLNLFTVEGDNWKRIRSITSPAFTSGKLRSMYPLMEECIDRLVAYFDRVSTSGDGLINAKEVMSGFTIDVIASSAFATKTNANDGGKKLSPFVYHGLNLFQFNPFKLMACLAFPRSVLNALNITHWFPEDSFKFMVDLSKKIIDQRKANPTAVKRNDLIQLMMDAFVYEEELAKNSYENLTASMESDDKKEKASTSKTPTNSTAAKRTLTENEIIAQIVLFFIAGFETTSTTLTHALFELAQHPEMQRRLVEDIQQAVEGIDKSNQVEYYEVILNQVPYLDAVLKETLRKYPPLVRLDRQVGVDGVKLGGIPLDKGVLIEIPTYAVHHDPDYYPDPEKFNPDRFLPENKHLLVPYTFIPFGAGPRNCVGMKFGFQEAKLCLASVIQKYQLDVTSQTPDKLTYRRGTLLLNCFAFPLRISVRV